MLNNENNPHSDPRDSSIWSALSLAWELGYTIAIPIIILALLGRLLDRKFGTSPWILLLGILVSLVTSSLAIFRKVARIMQTEQGIKNKESPHQSKQDTAGKN